MLQTKSITSGNSYTFEVNSDDGPFYISSRGAGSSSIVPWSDGATTGGTSFSQTGEGSFNMKGLSKFIVTAVGGDVEVTVAS